jgi:hypothetical protein
MSRPRFRCCPGTLRGSKLGSSPRRQAALPGHRADRHRRIRCGVRRPTGPPTRARPDPAKKKQNSSHGTRIGALFGVGASTIGSDVRYYTNLTVKLKTNVSQIRFLAQSSG